MEDKKKIKTLLFFLIIVLVIITIVYIWIKEEVFSKIARDNYQYEIMGVYKDPNVQIEDKTLGFEGITVLQKLDGQLPVSTTTSTIKKIFIEEIPVIFEYCKELDDIKLKEYYVSNSGNIEENLRIDTETSFINMINMIKNIKCNIREDYEKCSFFEKEGKIFVNFSYINNQIVEFYIKGNDAYTFNLEF